MPMVLGHEAAGEVVEAGPGRRGFAAGRPRGAGVRAELRRAAGRAVGGRAALCEPGAAANTAGTLLVGRAALAGRRLHHHLGVSAFADHIVVSAHSAVQVDPDLPLRDRRAVRLRRADRRGRRAQQRAGHAGGQRRRLRARRCRARGAARRASWRARTVVAVDVVPEKLELAARARRDPRDPGGRRRRRARSARPRAAAPTRRSRPSATRACSPQAYARHRAAAARR